MFLLTDTVRCFYDMAPLKLDARSVCNSLVSFICACTYVCVCECVFSCVCVRVQTFDHIRVCLVVKGNGGTSRWIERKMEQMKHKHLNFNMKQLSKLLRLIIKLRDKITC